MPDFTLLSSNAKQVSPYDYRGRANLAPFFLGRAISPYRAAKALSSALSPS